MAHRLIDDVISGARGILLDRDATVRYSDADLVSALNMAMDTCYTVRPDAFISLFSSGIPHYTAASLGTSIAFPLDDIFFSPFILFVVGWAELREEEYSSEGRAATFLSASKQIFRGG